MLCHPINAETPNNNHPSFKHHGNHGSQALPLDSGFRRNDVPPIPLALREGGMPC